MEVDDSAVSRRKFGGIDGGPGGNNHYIDNGDNYGFSVSHFLGH